MGVGGGVGVGVGVRVGVLVAEMLSMVVWGEEGECFGTLRSPPMMSCAFFVVLRFSPVIRPLVPPPVPPPVRPPVLQDTGIGSCGLLI